MKSAFGFKNSLSAHEPTMITTPSACQDGRDECLDDGNAPRMPERKHLSSTSSDSERHDGFSFWSLQVSYRKTNIYGKQLHLMSIHVPFYRRFSRLILTIVSCIRVKLDTKNYSPARVK